MMDYLARNVLAFAPFDTPTPLRSEALTMSIYRVAKSAWRILPSPIRSVLARIPVVRTLQDATVRAFQPRASHDDIYDAAFFSEHNDPLVASSFQAIAASIVGAFRPATVIDVGCGSADLLAIMQQHGVRTLGLEYATAGVEMGREKGVDVRRFDLETDDFAGPRDFDVAVSLETAEHLPAHVADRYVDLLASLAPVVVFTAATPGQGGTDHVNEQPPEYWEAKFAERGMLRDAELTEQLRCEWQAKGVLWFYERNLQVFRR